jgi:CubicO group peptidase (beta-lactamase class C family)
MKIWHTVMAAAIAFSSAAYAQEANPSKAFEPAALSAFADGVVATKMEQNHVPGVILAIVKDGKVMLSKGYGLANLEQKTPVDPDKTLFRIASVTKLFTATAIMQLHERGKIELKKDVNSYLYGLKIPAAFGQPILVEDLLMHTAGFDERYLGISSWNPNTSKTLLEYLREGMPRRVYPPKTLTIYSNYSVGLSGHIIASQMSHPYAQQINDELLRPLGMLNSAIELTNEQRPNIATPYRWKDNQFSVQPDDVIFNAPAGGLYTTANDMTRFMLMQLNNGSLDGIAILKPETAALMQQQQFTNAPGIPGICYGFYEEIHRGRRTIVHNGYWNRFSSKLMLVPELNLGLFLSANADGGGGVYDAVFDGILENFFALPPKSELKQTASPESLARAKQVAGVYRPARFTRHSVTKLESLMNQRTVVANDDGSINIRGNGGSTRYVEIAENVYMPEKGDEPIAFKRAGHHAFYFKDIESCERVAWWETRNVQIAIAVFFALTFLSAIVVLPFGRSKSTTLARFARMTGALMGVIALAFMGGLGYALGGMDRLEFVHEAPAILRILLYLPLLGLPVTVAVVWYQLKAIQNRYWSIVGRIHYIFLADITIAWYVYLWYWNLVGFNY